jgi:hypothetical protein
MPIFRILKGKIEGWSALYKVARWTAYPGDTKWSKNEEEKKTEIGRGN